MIRYIKSYLRWKKELRRLREEEYILSWKVFWCNYPEYEPALRYNHRKHNFMRMHKKSK